MSKKAFRPSVEMCIGAALALGATYVSFHSKTRRGDCDRVGRYMKISTFAENHEKIVSDLLDSEKTSCYLSIMFHKTTAKTYDDCIFERGENRVGIINLSLDHRDHGSRIGKTDFVMLGFEKIFPEATYENRASLEW